MWWVEFQGMSVRLDGRLYSVVYLSMKLGSKSTLNLN